MIVEAKEAFLLLWTLLYPQSHWPQLATQTLSVAAAVSSSTAQATTAAVIPSSRPAAVVALMGMMIVVMVLGFGKLGFFFRRMIHFNNASGCLA